MERRLLALNMAEGIEIRWRLAMSNKQVQELLPGTVYTPENLSSHFFNIPGAVRVTGRGCRGGSRYHPGYGPNLMVQSETPLQGTGFVLDGHIIRELRDGESSE
jgi:hypothetical protein